MHSLQLRSLHEEALPQIITNVVVKKGNKNKGEQRRTKVSFGRTMMRALELLRLAKRHIFRQSNIER